MHHASPNNEESSPKQAKQGGIRSLIAIPRTYLHSHTPLTSHTAQRRSKETQHVGTKKLIKKADTLIPFLSFSS